MATAILDKLLQTQFGKHLIFWVFLVLVGGNVAQWLDRKRQDSALEKCNQGRLLDEQRCSREKAKCDSLRIVDYTFFNQAIKAESERRKRWKQ